MTTSSYSRCNAITSWMDYLPNELKEITFETCADQPTGLIDFGKKWATEWPLRSLYLCGDWGCGKTTYCIALIRHLLEYYQGKGYFWPYYITGDDMERSLLEAIKSSGGDGYKLDTYAEANLLFIDDLDKANPSDRFKRQLFGIINRRLLNQKPTIITSNCQPDELAAVLDGAVISRMNDKTKWSIIKLSTPDFRKKKVDCIQF